MNAIGQLVGGFGLFILALSMMTDGLQLAAANQLKTVLKRGTTPPWRGLLSGMSMTMLVQSSSAVTVATIGFVNAGLIGLAQAVSVILGTNIGTTVTGWLVSFVGFEFKIAIFALPMVGVGMAIKLLAGGRSTGGYGLALAGFGLFFLGLDFLKDGFAGASGAVNVQFVSQMGIAGILLSLLIGFLITAVAQSSSAAVALVLTAAQGGVIFLPSAAAMVIGANIGTTSTALLATIGATNNARRVAWAHVAFNLLTGVVAIILLFAGLPWLADFGAHLERPALFLALFHTAFNVMGVILVWPWKQRLVDFLERRIRSAEEDAQRPVYLDTTLVASPALAVSALLHEMVRVRGFAIETASAALEGRARDWVRGRQMLAGLIRNVYGFATHVQRSDLPEDASNALTDIMRAAQYYLESGDLARNLVSARAAIADLEDPNAKRRSSRFANGAVELVKGEGRAPSPIVPPITMDETDALEEKYHELRKALFDQLGKGEVEADAVNALLEKISDMMRLLKRLGKAAGVLNNLASANLANGDPLEAVLHPHGDGAPGGQPIGASGE